MLIAILSGPVLNKVVSAKQWSALVLGVIGVLVVLSAPHNWQGNFHVSDIFLLIVGLFSIVLGTLIQKRYAEKVDLITGLAYQFSASLIYLSFMVWMFETGEIIWAPALIATLAWMVIPLSLFSVLLLMYLIKNGDATRVASYFLWFRL